MSTHGCRHATDVQVQLTSTTYKYNFTIRVNNNTITNDSSIPQ